jgi:hypothetical protein
MSQFWKRKAMNGEQNISQGKKLNFFDKWLPLLTELWIFAVIAMFFVIRILGSNSAKHFLCKASY